MNTKSFKKLNIKWLLLAIDTVIFFGVFCLLTFFYAKITTPKVFVDFGITLVLLTGFRFAFSIYTCVWRYGGIVSYIRLALAEVCALLLYRLLGDLFLRQTEFWLLNGITTLAIFGCDGFIALMIRLCYRVAYTCMNDDTRIGRLCKRTLSVFRSIKKDIDENANHKINVAIIGAGRTGTSLAEELLNNSTSGYKIKLFGDLDKEKIGRKIYETLVVDETKITHELLSHHDVDEIIFALPNIKPDVKANLFNKYKSMGYKIRVYDYPNMAAANNNKKALRDFDIDELLFRESVALIDKDVSEYYKDKTVMITGGGGSIGSELARQIAKMSPKMLILVDVYENGAYDVQQELKLLYGDDLTLKVDILSVTNKVYLEKLFIRYKVDIVIHAAAHKHVPLMERNCLEAVANNVFGTYNVVDLAYKYKCERFIMVSTDKAVNPTNVMGATKRMCEMIVQAYSTKEDSQTKFSFTRFGNVLGSAGSVIPLFKKQIANGGPVTITDKRIIRYFMTIPEAASLVLESGYMAKNGELFVLDMGKPIKILELAENIISLAGYRPYVDIDIKEVGLRPGEKLYEELLIKTENLTKTKNKLIFIEKDTPISMDEMNEKLSILKKAIDSNTNAICRDAMKEVVPTYKSPEEVNIDALDSDEMKEAR